MKIWQSIRERPPWVWALTGVIAIGIVVAAMLVRVGGGTDTSSTLPSMTTTQPATTTASVTTTAQTSTATTQPPTTTTRPRSTTTTARVPPRPVPGIVIASAGSAGGSGEVQVDWKAVTRATGYRVYLTDSAGRHARLMADVNVVTGRATAAVGVSTIWSDTHTYVPMREPLTHADHSSRLHYVDAAGSTTRYYRVQAYNAAGAGPLSAVTGGTPVIGPPPGLPT